jgi:nitrite reductase/ring-hydroxylating ferredoxin subunit
MSAVTGVAVPAEKVPAPGMRTLFEPAGNSLALFNVAGQIYAIDDSCPHQGSSLCGGRLEGRVIQCCAHGLRFDLASGYLLNSTRLKVASYPVEVVDGQVFIVLAAKEVAV